MKSYDVVIIGAGITGCALAYELHRSEQDVLVFEKEGIASGGSGAAGAFINPKISKAGPLKELIEQAYLYSLQFYKTHFLDQTNLAPLLHIAKYTDDNEKVEYFKAHTSLKSEKPPEALTRNLTPYALGFNSVYLKDNAVVEAKEVCEQMLKGIELREEKVLKPEYRDGFWFLNGVKTKKLVLCTGGYETPVPEEYINLRRIYGQRCEVESATEMAQSVHHEVSISVSKKNGRIAIGASHYLDKKDIPEDEDGARHLIDLACKTLQLEEVKITDVYTGMRSGSNDYLPLLGPLVNAKKSLEEDSSALEGNTQASLVYHNNLYMMNGVGGYGFVLAPYLATIMTEHFVQGKELPEFLEPKRFYYRMMKKRGKQ